MSYPGLQAEIAIISLNGGKKSNWRKSLRFRCL